MYINFNSLLVINILATLFIPKLYQLMPFDLTLNFELTD